MEPKTISNRKAHNRTCRFRKINKKGVRVALEVTNNCNFNCTHCFVRKKKEQPPLELLLNLIKQFKDIDCQKVIITGGEPLLRNDLEIIIECISNQGILADLNSNFYLLHQNRLKTLINAGLKEASVSLYGNAKIHNKIAGIDNAFEIICKNIQLLTNQGLAVDVHAGIFDENIHQPAFIAQLASQLGCDSLTFFSIIDRPLNSSNSKHYKIDKQKLLDEINSISANCTIPINTIGLIETDLDECSMCEAIIGINANLEMTPCLLAKNKYPIKEAGINLKNLLHCLQNEVKNGLWTPNCV